MDSSTAYITIKTTSVCDGDARTVDGGRGWLAGDTDGLAGWPVTGDGGRGQPASTRCWAVQRGWVGVVTGISAASTGSVLV